MGNKKKVVENPSRKWMTGGTTWGSQVFCKESLGHVTWPSVYRLNDAPGKDSLHSRDGREMHSSRMVNSMVDGGFKHKIYHTLDILAYLTGFMNQQT